MTKIFNRKFVVSERHFFFFFFFFKKKILNLILRCTNNFLTMMNYLTVSNAGGGQCSHAAELQNVCNELIERHLRDTPVPSKTLLGSRTFARFGAAATNN